jgi:hypothetical protein
VEAGEVAYYVDDLERPAFKDTGRKDLQPGDRLVLGNYGILTADQTVTCVDEIRITEKTPRSAPEGKVTGLTYTASPRPAAGDQEGKALVDGKESPTPGPGQVQWKAFTKEVELVFDWQRERNLSRIVLQACASPATNLYVAFESPFQGAALRTTVLERDGPVWEDDSVEIFLIPPGWPGKYLQFVGNSVGAFYDSVAGGEGPQYNGRFQYRCSLGDWDTYYTRGVWRGELALPFRELGVPSPEDGTAWKANFCRNWYTGSEGKRRGLDRSAGDGGSALQKRALPEQRAARAGGHQVCE